MVVMLGVICLMKIEKNKFEKSCICRVFCLLINRLKIFFVFYYISIRKRNFFEIFRYI